MEQPHKIDCAASRHGRCRAWLLLPAALTLLLASSALLAGNPYRAEHFLRKGMEAMRAEEFGKAEDLFLRARRADPLLPQPEVMLGHLAMAQAQFDNAEAAFLRAIELYRNLKSNLQQRNQREIQAAKDDLDLLTRALETTENNARLGDELAARRVQRVAERDRREQQIQRAELSEEALRIPGELFLFLGNARMRAGRPAEAAEAYGEAVNRLPEAPEPRYNLAVALARSGRLDEALQECARVEKMGYAPSALLRQQLEALQEDPPPPSDPVHGAGSPD